jgi:uncharacterized membrane protein
VNAIPSPDGWGVPSECSRRDLYMAVNRYKSGWDGSCHFLAYAVTGGEVAERPKAWTEALKFAGREGLRLPTGWLQIGFRSSNRRDMVDARFHFDPAALGSSPADPAAWSTDPWNPRRIVEDEIRLAVVQRMAAWADAFDTYVDLGLKNRIEPDLRLPSPLGTLQLPDQTRLKSLEKLRDDGALNGRDFEIQRALLAKQSMEYVVPDIDQDTVGFYKALSFRPLAALASVFVDLYWIGQPVTAGVLAFLQATAGTPKTYLHETLWDRYLANPAGRSDLARRLDFLQAARMI